MLFAAGILVAFIVMLFASAALGALLPGEGYASLGGLAGRLFFSAVMVAWLARLGWLRSGGLASLGTWRAWLLLPLPLAYAVGAAAFAITGRLDLTAFGPLPAGVVVVFIAAAAGLEALAFRGLILHGLVRAWGGTARGRVVSVVAAALFFGGLHLLDGLSGRPMLNVLTQSGQAIVLGVWLGALVLRTGSQYPAMVFHILFNLAGYQLFGRRGLEPSPEAWLLLGALLLPLAAIGLGEPGRPRARAAELPAAAVASSE
jgi:membrane protease YdiL (CAAX protease family)